MGSANLALLFSILAASGALQEGHAAVVLVEAPSWGAAKPSYPHTKEAAAAAADGGGPVNAGVKQRSSSLGEAARHSPRPKLRGGSHLCIGSPDACSDALSPEQVCCFNHFCADLSSEDLNCGKCGNRCKMPESCCSGKCVNTLSDPANCGGCGKACAPGECCTFGMCGYA